MAAAWLEFWDGSRTTFVNSPHKDVHYRLIANDIAQLVPSPQAPVLDYGVGKRCMRTRSPRLLLS